MKKCLTCILLSLAVLIGAALAAYPAVSNLYYQKHQSQILAQYQQKLEQVDNTKLLEERAKAEVYNGILRSGTVSTDAYSSDALVAAAQDYGTLLNLAGDGIMGYLEIPVIGVKLPIYHGTEGNTLEIGVGHLLGSSLPIGGESCHAVLSAHSGMAGQKMFSDLPQLKYGDKFYLTVLGETMAYQVDQIAVVLPHESELLEISSGEDLCTLFTCTPFGVNTHRLLVRGTRIPYEKSEEGAPEQQEVERTESTWDQEYLKSILVGVGCAVILVSVIWSIVALRDKRRKRRA